MYRRELLAGTGLILMAVAPAWAEAPKAGAGGADDGAALSEIIVTAQRREQRLQDVPVSVSVATGDSLAQTNITGLQDLAVRLPNVRLASAFGSNLLNIRGVGSGLNQGFEQSVGTFLDGVYRGRARATSAALFDVERVEILRGPQTTFFGNNVIAGALNITTRKPEFKFGGNASALYAPADGEYTAELGLNIPLSNTLAVRLAGKLYGMDGYVHNEALSKDEPRSRDAAGRVSVRWEPSSQWRTDFRVDVSRLRDHPTLEADGCPPDPLYGPARGTCLRFLNSGRPGDGRFDYHSQNFGGIFDYDFTEFALTNSFDLGPATLTSTTAHFDHDYQVLTDAAPLNISGVGGGASATPINVFEHVKQFSQEVRLTSAPGKFLDYMVGGHYSTENLLSDTYVGNYFAPFSLLIGPAVPPGTLVANLQSGHQETDTWSVFGSATVRPIEKLSIDLGLRYSHVTKTIDRSFEYGAGGAIPGPGTFVPFSQTGQLASQAILGGVSGNYLNPRHTDDKLMPSVKIPYNLAPDVMTYASYTKGFKAGGFAIATGLFEFAEETVDAYEVGLKASLFDRRVFSSLALYRSDYADLQESTNTVNGAGVLITTITNAARSRAQGVESALDVKVVPGLTFHSDVAYSDSKYQDYSNAPCTILGNLVLGCVQNMSGKRRAYAPKFSGNVGIDYVGDIFDGLQIRVDPSAYFTSRYFQSATADPLLEQSGYTKFDLRVGLGAADGSWELAVIGKNLTDQKTASFRNQFAGAPGTTSLIAERPRSVAFQAAVKF
jgi:iron complex outermembrane receptor protein